MRIPFRNSIANREVTIATVIVKKIETKNRGFIFGSCDAYPGEDILIPCEGNQGTRRDFHKLKNGDEVEGDVLENQYGQFRIPHYRIVSK